MEARVLGVPPGRKPLKVPLQLLTHRLTVTIGAHPLQHLPHDRIAEGLLNRVLRPPWRTLVPRKAPRAPHLWTMRAGLVRGKAGP